MRSTSATGKRQTVVRNYFFKELGLIETKRLIIRYHHPEDWKDLFEYLSLPETYVFEPGNPISIEEVKIISIERSKGKSFSKKTSYTRMYAKYIKIINRIFSKTS